MKKIFGFLCAIISVAPVFATEHTIGSVTAYEATYETSRTVNFKFDDEQGTYYLQIKAPLSLNELSWIFISDEQLKTLQGLLAKTLEWGKIVEDNKVEVQREIPGSQITSQVTWKMGDYYFSANQITLAWHLLGAADGDWVLVLTSSRATSRQNQFITYSTEVLYFTKQSVRQLQEITDDGYITKSKAEAARKKERVEELFPDDSKDADRLFSDGPDTGAEVLATTGKLFFVTITDDGTPTKAEASRKIPKSDDQLIENIRQLLLGVNDYEDSVGLMSLIPDGTRLLSATVRDGMAWLNFSEEFEYNLYGVEGVRASLMQVVYTATEFPQVNRVRILIDGQEKDWLETVWIGSPLARNSF